jgi:hypothetical protein
MNTLRVGRIAVGCAVVLAFALAAQAAIAAPSKVAVGTAYTHIGYVMNPTTTSIVVELDPLPAGRYHATATVLVTNNANDATLYGDCYLKASQSVPEPFVDHAVAQVSGPTLSTGGPSVTLPLDRVLEVTAAGAIWVECSPFFYPQPQKFSARLTAVTLAGIVVMNP